MNSGEDFYQLENEIVALKKQIDGYINSEDPTWKEKVAQLRHEIELKWAEIQPNLTAVQIVQIARHPKRPYSLDYIAALFEEFVEVHGDRHFADDPAIVAGFAFYKGKTAAVIGHQKGRTTRERLDRNFGQPNPEGYRKAFRVMKLAEKFGFPIITIIDTQGAYPGIGAEERGQAEAIAFNLKAISMLRTPVINVVVGEGGSGGALGIGVGDIYLMLENSFYSVISPEGCAAILWRDQNMMQRAATSLKLTAKDLVDMGIIDKIIPEPPGGAHMDYETTFRNVDKYLYQALKKIEQKPIDALLEDRYQKFRKIGFFLEK